MRFRYNVLNVNVSIEVQWLNGKHISSFSKTWGVLTKYIYAGRRRRQGGDIVRRQPLCQIKSSEVDNDEEDDDDDDGEGDDHDDDEVGDDDDDKGDDHDDSRFWYIWDNIVTVEGKLETER